jgi:hypothetical protein
MTPNVITIEEEAPVAKAAELMLQSHIHRLLVIDEEDVPLGILSTTDIIRDMRGSKWVWYMG